MKWTDVTGGLMNIKDIQEEVDHQLNSCKEISKLLITIERRDNGKFYTKFYIKVSDFKKKMCGKCHFCLSVLSDIFVY